MPLEGYPCAIHSQKALFTGHNSVDDCLPLYLTFRPKSYEALKLTILRN